MNKKTILTNSKGFDFIVIGEPFRKQGKHQYYAMVKFLQTNNEQCFRVDLICSGKIKDSISPIICGVGYIGDISIPHTDEFGRKMYQCWLNIIKRCYNKNRHDYARYGGAGVTVSKEWLCFANFYHDVQKLPGFDKEKFLNSKIQLDKDKSVFDLNTRQYNKEKCQWLSVEENYTYRRPRNYRAYKYR